MGKTNETDGSARSGHVKRHVDGFKRADTLQDRFGPPMRLLKHFLHGLLISGRDDIGGPTCLRQFQPLLPVSDEKDTSGPQTFGGQDSTESDGSIANHYDRAACLDPCGDGSMIACRHDIGEGKDGFEQLLVAFHRGRKHYQGTVGVGDANGLALAAIMGTAPARSMYAGAWQTCTTELAGAIRDQERGDHAIPLFDGAHLRPDLLDHPHPLVSHAISRLTLIDATIGPQIRATNTRMRNTGNHIGWGLNDGIGDLVDAHISRSMINGCSHSFLLFTSSGCLSGRSHALSQQDLPLKKKSSMPAKAERHILCLVVIIGTLKHRMVE